MKKAMKKHKVKRINAWAVVSEHGYILDRSFELTRPSLTIFYFPKTAQLERKRWPKAKVVPIEIIVKEKSR